MNAVETNTPKLTMAEKLVLAQEAFHQYYISCFWFMREDFQVTEATLPIVIKGLRSDGDHAAFKLAARLCQ